MARPDDTLVLRPRVQRPDEVLRPTRAEIDLSAIRDNARTLAAAVAPAEVLAVIKADAYGHGVAPVARALQDEGVYGFGVALAEEGIELREAGISGAILILNGVYGGAHEEVLARGLTPVVYDMAQIEAFADAAKGEPFGVHLKVDTGMGRLGVAAARVEAFLQHAAEVPGLRIDGLMTHFASADSDPEFTTAQRLTFEIAVSRVRAAGFRPTIRHAANTAGALLHPEARYELVRAGIALFGYGGHELDDEPIAKALRPAMRLRSEIVALRELEPGHSVGYDRQFIATRPTTVATFPMGYGDGLLRASSGRGHVLVRGARCAVLGNVSMDLTSVDVTGLGASVGDEVVILGAQGQQRLDVRELAQAAGTLPYEIFCSISRRVPRFYR